MRAIGLPQTIVLNHETIHTSVDCTSDTTTDIDSITDSCDYVLDETLMGTDVESAATYCSGAPC